MNQVTNLGCVIGVAARRNQAARWLRQMDQVARDTLPEDPSEEDFCLALRNGLILCNVLNKVQPGAVLKVRYILYCSLCSFEFTSYFLFSV